MKPKNIFPNKITYHDGSTYDILVTKSLCLDELKGKKKRKKVELSPNIEYVIITDRSLEEVIIPKDSKLKSLSCKHCNISDLDIRNAPDLDHLYLNNNPIENIHLHRGFKKIECDSLLKFSGNIDIEELILHGENELGPRGTDQAVQENAG